MIEASNLPKAMNSGVETVQMGWTSSKTEPYLRYLLSLRLGPGGDSHKSLCEVGDRGLGSGRGLVSHAFSLSL